jgi:2-polyprenyl-3-methyl-5-hydroxy-6-metoxy-1,4-benzoquinol methylase
MRESGEAFAKSLGITRGLKILDLGCGDGKTALPQARLGADVLGVDIASNLVAAGISESRSRLGVSLDKPKDDPERRIDNNQRSGT